MSAANFNAGVRRFIEWARPLQRMTFPVEFLTNAPQSQNGLVPFSEEALPFTDFWFVAFPSPNSVPMIVTIVKPIFVNLDS